MTRKEIQARIVDLMREIREKQEEIARMVKQREELDTE